MKIKQKLHPKSLSLSGLWTLHVCFVVVLSGKEVSSGLQHFDSLKSVCSFQKVGLKRNKIKEAEEDGWNVLVCIRECETHL